MSRKNKKYFQIKDYGDLLFPVSLLEKFVSECVIIEKEWDSVTNDYRIKSIKQPKDIALWDGEDLDLAEAEQKLRGD